MLQEGSDVIPLKVYDPSDYISKVELDAMPEELLNLVEQAGWHLTDTDSVGAIVTGESKTGKTFIITQILYNIEEFIYGSNLSKVVPIRMTIPDYKEIQNSFKTVADIAKHISSVTGCKNEEIVIITDSVNVALKISSESTGMKLLLEADLETMDSIMKSKTIGGPNPWANWIDIDAGEVALTASEMKELVYLSLEPVLSKKYSLPLEKDYVSTIVELLILSSDDNVFYELDEKSKLYLSVPPGIIATLVKKFVQVASNKFEYKGKKLTHAQIKEAFDVVTKSDFYAYAKNLAQSRATGFTGVAAPVNTPDIAIVSSDEIPDEIAKELLKFAEQQFGGNGNRGVPSTVKDVKKFFGKYRSQNVLMKKLQEGVIGQKAAIEKIVDAFSLPAAGLNTPEKPIRTFLFMGPTGVGKTETAKLIADNLFTEKLNVIRLDMSEFSHEGSVSGLFGSNPGYIGYSEDGGQLTKEVANNPHSLIILDEVEKAHPAVWDAFLQVFDAARMTTGSGKVVDFSNCVIVMTSNLGTEEMSAKGIGFGESTKTPDDLERIGKAALKKYFRVEFLNRIDEIVIFNSLNKDSAKKIVKKEIEKLNNSAIKDSGHKILGVSDDILEGILRVANFSEYGAREVQRAVQREIAVPLAKQILKSKKKNRIFKVNVTENSAFEVVES